MNAPKVILASNSPRRLKFFHHLGIPSGVPRKGEIYDRRLKLWRVPGNRNAYGVEWIRFHDDCDYPELVRNCAHVAFETATLETDLRDERVVVEPHATSAGVVAMVEVDGAPVEFIQLDRRIVGDEYDAWERPTPRRRNA